MDFVNASVNILNAIFYGQDSGNEAGAASCTPIEVRGLRKPMRKRSQATWERGLKGRKGDKIT